jgi:serine/threonine protein kinase
MAILQERRSPLPLYLRSLHLFGRSPAQNDTTLSNADASQIHASIRWNGAQWEIVDHSSYGTLIDAMPVLHHARQLLAVGQIIRFGPAAQQSWEVKNLDAPCPMLIPLSPGQTPIALHQLVCLPDNLTPEATIYLGSEGQWQWDNASGNTVLQDGDIVTAAGARWQFHNGMTLAMTSDVSTCRTPVSADVAFDFGVSQNEEHIHLQLHVDGKTLDLGERSHHYHLLTLARRRCQDAGNGYDALSQGWTGMAELAGMLGIEEKHINVYFQRARSQIAQHCTHAELVANCIERRRGEVRFGQFRFEIRRGAMLEACFDPRAADTHRAALPVPVPAQIQAQIPAPSPAPAAIRLAQGSLLTSVTQQHYRLLHLLGQGGGGSVFEALQIASGKLVALKLMHAGTDHRHDQVFAREMHVCMQLQHLNIAALLDQGQAGNGQWFAVFELVPGQTLKERLIQQGALPPLEAGAIMAQVLTALVGIHANGIAHCDLRPENIMLSPPPPIRLATGHVADNTAYRAHAAYSMRVTLLDFGLAAALPGWPAHGEHNAHDAPPVTDRHPPGTCLCSPAYSAPEQLRGAQASTKVDLYAWGLLLLECLTGQAAVCGHNVAEIFHRQLASDDVPIPAPLRTHPLANLLRRVLHKDAAFREASASALQRDFLQIDLSDITINLQAARRGMRQLAG